MDWDLKMPPSWDFAELQQNAEPSIGSAIASARASGGVGRQGIRPDCSVDLKLGGLGEFGSSERWQEQARVSVTTLVSPAGPSKRARAPSNGNQVVSCLVDGCKSDLSKCRDYHRRHKVCEVHSKTQMVLVGGQEQRFCQQCSRFHLLVEFDEVKRSCRKRLDGHNRRRRKSQPDSISSGSFVTHSQGARFTSYPSIFPTQTPDPNWAGIVKTEDDSLYHSPLHLMNRQQHHPSSFSITYKEGKQFPFLQESNTSLGTRAMLENSVHPPFLKTISSSEGSGAKMFSNGLTPVLDCNRALSLLSSPTQTTTIHIGQMGPAYRIPLGQPLLSSMQHGGGGLSRYTGSQASSSVSPTGFSCSGIGNEHVGTVLVADANDADLHCQAMFHVGGEGSSDETSSQALPFSWQ